MSKKKSTATSKLPSRDLEHLLSTLEDRFEANRSRHQGMNWSDVLTRIEPRHDKLLALFQMEQSGGEPDVVSFDKKSGEFIFFDCSAESPTGRRSLCYDREGLESRKEHRPANCAIDMAAQMGIEILNEAQYRHLQTLGTFDAKTSSWLLTPVAIRKLGGAIFGDFRYGQVFVYHNGAQSYYGARGFRGVLKV